MTPPVPTANSPFRRAVLRFWSDWPARLGVAGILPPTTSALLHNMSTLAIGLKSMTNLLPESEQSSVH